MMESNTLNLTLDRSDLGYVPGEPIAGRVSWDIGGEIIERVVVRLFWRTEGKGTQDVGVWAEEVFDLVSAREERAFEFEGAVSPYSFSGQLISIVWAVEAIVEPLGEVKRVDLVLSPTGKEVAPDTDGE